MPNSLLNISILTNEMLRLVEDELGDWGDAVYSDAWSISGAKIGYVVNIYAKPVFRMRDLRDLTGADAMTFVVHPFQAVELCCQASAQVHMSLRDLTLSIDECSKDFLDPAAFALAQQIKDRWFLGATLVTADLPLPQGVHMAARASNRSRGLRLRCVRAYDINTDVWLTRFDMLCGFANKPEIAPWAAAKIDMLLQNRAALVAQLADFRALRI